MFALISTLVAKVRAWQERQASLNELYAMDDRSLADIGLRRADIPYVVSGETEIQTVARPARQPANVTMKHAA